LRRREQGWWRRVREVGEPEKTVFGVPPSWVSEGQIKKEYLDEIRKVCGKLSLAPSGFVVLPEAIAHAVKLEEGSPLTGIVIGVGKDMIDMSVFRLGGMMGTVNVGRSVSIVDDVIEGLVRFSAVEHLPSRILIYDGRVGELEEVQQSLVGVDWKEASGGKLNFLHAPKVEIIDTEDKVVAVSLAGASEIGEVEGIAAEEERRGVLVEEVVEEERDNRPELSRVGEVDLGKMGFVVGRDVREEGTLERTEVIEEEQRVEEGQVKRRWFRMPAMKFWRWSGRLSLPRVGIPGGGRKWVLGLVTAGLVLLLGGAGVAWWVFPKAEVVVYVSPKTLGESVFLTFDTEVDEVDLQGMVVPAETVSVEVAGTKTKSTTGSRLVGERAKGKVTVRNGTSAGRKLAGDTVLVGPSDLRFSMADSASVSAASSPSAPGTVSMEVEAADIGAEYNLAKDEVLTVGNYPKSEVDAIAENDFSGGSSREVVAVSAGDLEKLEEDLKEELLAKGKGKIEGEIGSGMKLIGDEMNVRVLNADYSHEEGEEADSVEMEMTVEVVGLVVSKANVENLAGEVLGAKVPEGFVLRAEQVKADFEAEDSGDGWWEFDVNFQANLLPEVNPDEVAAKVVGKRPATAEEYLRNTVPGYRRSEIKIKPTLPGVLGVIPRVKKNVSVEVVADS